MMFFEAFAFTKLGELQAIGNPANVVVFDDSEEMDDAVMSHVSSVRFGRFLITVFIKKRANSGDYDLRYYTQYGKEWPSLCGHGTICAAGVVKKFFNSKSNKVSFFLSGNRVIHTTVDDDSATINLPISQSRIIEDESIKKKICETLKIKNSTIKILYKSAMNDYVVYLNNDEPIRKISPDLGLLAKYANELDYRVMIVVQNSNEKTIDIEVKAISHLALNKEDDNGEDTACGSANCSIAPVMKDGSYTVLFPYQFKFTGEFGGLQKISKIKDSINLTGGFRVKKI